MLESFWASIAFMLGVVVTQPIHLHVHVQYPRTKEPTFYTYATSL